MTFREYENLCIGDKVRLPFSSYPDQIVIKANNDVVETLVFGASAHERGVYVNNYKDIELVK